MNKNNFFHVKIPFWQKIARIICGALIALALLETGLRLSRFIILTIQEHRIMASIRQRGHYRILCLGESTTQDQDPRLLETILNQGDLGIRFSVTNVGKDGLNSGVIVNRIGFYLDKYRPDMVVAMMGICDCAELLPYARVSSSKAASFLRSMQTYKLTRSFWLHMVAKAKGMGLYEPDEFKVPVSKETHVVKVNNLDNEDVLRKEQDYVKLAKFYQSQGRLQQAEEYFKKALELNPGNNFNHVALGMFYQSQARLPQAEECFKKALGLNPGNDVAYAGLGILYQFQGYSEQAEAYFKKALEFNPRSDLVYAGLGKLYLVRNGLQQAEKCLRKALESDPRNEEAYVELGNIYQSQGRLQQAEEYFKKALELNPENDLTYTGHENFYLDPDGLQQMEEAYKKALELNSGNEEAYLWLAWVYQFQGRLSEAEECLKKSLEAKPYYISRLYGALAVVYEEAGQHDLSQKYYDKEKELDLRYYNSLTMRSYQTLKEILDKRKIKLVCVQYPMRDIRALKKIFQDQENIIFIDNEKIFKDAVRRDGYKEYFRDMSGGDFGHCTEKGSRLLVEHIADTLLKEVFPR